MYQKLHEAWNYDAHCPRETRRWWQWILAVYFFWGLPYGGPLAPFRAMATGVISGVLAHSAITRLLV